MTSLIVAEKPSVARDLARVLKIKKKGEGCYQGQRVWITWCLGHMAELCEPDEYNPAWKTWSAGNLPIIPEQFRVRPVKRTMDHWKALKKLLRSSQIEQVINACDAGREGELIFRYAYELAGCTRPVRRLWLSSLTDQAIQDGLRDMRPGSDYDPLADAARCRSEADWLVGINATRAMTILGRRHGGSGQLFSVGRVQTPTLAMLVEREDEIDAFVPEPFWQVYATFAVEEGTYEGLWTRDKDNRLGTRPEAEAIIAAIDGQTGTIARVDQKKVRENPPLLYDLTQLQRMANRRYGFSAARTLAAAQALYEKHKLLTYPRTDSNYLTSDMVPSLPGRVRGIDLGPYAPFCQHLLASLPLPTSKRIVNDKEVGDHHAIIPTGKRPNLESLADDERKVFDLVARRFLAVFYPPAIFATTHIETHVAAHAFMTRGRVCLDAGWQAVEPPPSARKAQGASDSGQGKEPEQELPRVARGQQAHVHEHRIHEGMTTPPRRYNEASLLGAMERAGNDLQDDELRRAMKEAGLGTPATRAAIIETLLKRDFVSRDGKNLVPTPKGRALIHAIPVAQLKNARLTGAWEARLSHIADGRMARDAFMDEVRKLTSDLIPLIMASSGQDMGASVQSDVEPLGTCPLCKTPVTEARKAFVCQSGRDCDFVIFKTIAKRKISPKLVQVLLDKGRSQTLKGFRSKAGKPFEAALVLEASGKVTFDFQGDNGASAPRGSRGPARPLDGPPPGPPPEGLLERPPQPDERDAPPPAPVAPAMNDAPEAADTPEPPTCPACQQGHVIQGRRGWGCSRWREGCRFVVWFEINGRAIPEDEADRLFRKGRTRMMNGFHDDDGSPVRARLALDIGAEGNVRLERSQARGASKSNAEDAAAAP